MRKEKNRVEEDSKSKLGAQIDRLNRENSLLQEKLVNMTVEIERLGKKGD